MVELVVSAEQAKLLAEARENVEIVDAKGNRLGFFARRFSADEIAIALDPTKTSGSSRSTAELLDRINALESR